MDRMTVPKRSSKPTFSKENLMQWIIRLAVLASALSLLPSLVAQEGVSAKEITLGMVNAQSGPAANLGSRMRAGAFAFFRRTNAAGGVHGRTIRLIAYDDGYEPDRTQAMTKKLLTEDKVFGLLGYVGTPTCVAALPLVQEGNIPFVGPFTGADILRNPVKKSIFNIRASYFDETEGLIQRFTTDLGISRIGILIQDDAFGAAGEAGVLKALAKRKLTLVGKGTFKRNTMEVEAGLAELQKANPEAVILVGPYTPLSAFVKRAHAKGFKPLMATISFVGTESLVKNLGPEGEGLIISQVLPPPTDTSHPLVKGYLADLAASAGGDPDYTSLEGYVAAAVFTAGLGKAGPNLNRTAFISAMDALQMDLGGALKPAFSPTNHQGLRTIYFTRIKGGKAVPITKF
jgi:ABC-type branched-subunit amino acid transport system substrate-binding protein